MHAVAHSLAHRAPPATRARVRWQPYNPIPSSAVASSSSSSTHSSASSISSPITSLNTPDSSVSSPHSTSPCDIEPSRQPSTSTLPPPQKEIPPREPSRSKHALGLVDQAVKSLCEIWRPQDIPSAFLSSTGGLVPLSASLEHIRLQQQSHLTARSTTQLPPAFPTAPSVASTSAVPSFAPTTPAPSADSDAEARSMAVPIKGFVHEVLRRSRTSGHVLQTALCYLEAIRPKIPELANKEKTGEAALLEAELESRIVPATEAELAQEQASQSDMATDAQYTIQPAEDVMDTIRVSDSSSGPEMPYIVPDISLSQTSPKSSSISAGAALSRLPTPLLCPRRAFLAALILASKFTQDKCYSNRAWAKLSGLPAREIGRCERALGDALDWRLWVGKSAAPPPLAAAQRPMARSSSEANLFKSAPSPVIACERKSTVSTPADDAPSNTRRLRKCVTLPAEAFSTSKGVSARSRIVREKFLPSTGLPYDKSALPSTTSIPYDRSALSIAAPSIPGFENFCPSNMKYPSSRSGLSEKMNQSPSPDTPGLTYSPSSTESCSGGDRTIQMTTFLDDNMGNFNPSQSLTSTESWQYLEDMASFNAQAAMGQGQTLSEKKMDFTSAPQIYIPSDSPPSMFMTSLDTLLSKPGPYGPDMRGSYPHEMTGDYLTMGLSD